MNKREPTTFQALLPLILMGIFLGIGYGLFHLKVEFLLILTAAFKLLLSAVKLSGPFWKGRKGKTILRLVTVTLGVAVWLTAQWGMGVGWFEAVVLGFSGPLAVALHEYQYLIPALARKKDKKKEE